MQCTNDVYLTQSDKALPTLFKKYMQVSADHARKYGGTGLGLAICKQLVICISFPFNFSIFGSYITFVLFFVYIPNSVFVTQKYGQVDFLYNQTYGKKR